MCKYRDPSNEFGGLDKQEKHTEMQTAYLFTRTVIA